MEKYQLKDGGYIEVIQDESPESPREWSNLAKMVCFHSRYTLGDEHDYRQKNYNGWAEMEADIIKKENVAVIKKVFLYDHSGITIATEPFSCKWDSGQIGYVFITKETAKKEYSVKRISPKLRERLLSYIDGEIEVYDQYLTGDVYGFKEYDKDGVEIDSCWGFFGNDPKTNGISEHLSSEIV